MKKSQTLLENHPVNRARQSKGLPPANSIWLWGQGRSPRMVTLKERFGMDGYVISAVHLIKGIGILAGLEVLEVPGITGYFDTNYDGKAQYALKGLKEKDFVYLHVESPDEAGHMGDLRLKIEAIEAFDKKIVGAILRGMKEFKRYKNSGSCPIIPRLSPSEPILLTRFPMLFIRTRMGRFRSWKNL